MAFPLIALLLFAGQPVVTTARTQAPAPVSAPVSTAGADLSERPVDRDTLPQGAPEDDYRFVAWCDGVLAGHMDIAERVKDVLPIDDVQQKIGKSYLRAYVRALDSSPQSKTAEGRQAAETARLDGFNKWEQARNADHKLAAETYLSYQLPPRCEHAALRLSHNPNLFKSTPGGGDQVATVATGARRVADPNATGAATKGLLFSPNKPATAAAVSAPVSAPVPNAPASTETVAVVAAPASQAPEPKSPAPGLGAGAAVMPNEPAVMAEAAPAPAAGVTTAAAAPAVAKAADSGPEKAPAKALEQPSTKAADKPVAKKPKRGHLLPPFLRKKDPDEE
jgi:hypothetical protein